MGLLGFGRKPVVGGVILSATRTHFLAAQRSYPPALAGKWELPGGKSEPGESPQTTLRRELMEELGIRVNVLERLSGTENVPNSDLRLQVWVVQLAGGTPRLIEGHRKIEWLSRETINSVPWLPSNKRFVAQIPRFLVT